MHRVTSYAFLNLCIPYFNIIIHMVIWCTLFYHFVVFIHTFSIIPEYYLYTTLIILLSAFLNLRLNLGIQFSLKAHILVTSQG